MSVAVELDTVTKRFGTKTAVDGVSLRVAEGSIHGFIGPNGSGKTTTMRMIIGIIHPDQGAISVHGRPQSGTAHDDVAYLPEERGLYRKIPVLRQLTHFGTLKGMSRHDARTEARHWLERLDLAASANLKLEALSKGMSQKIQFIAAVIARPRLLILDEPFSGLDPVNYEVLQEAILELRAAGTTVIFSTHDMGTAERLCDAIFMIYRGQKVLDGQLEDIRARHGTDAVRVAYLDGRTPDPALLPAGATFTTVGRDFEIRGAGDPHALLPGLAAAGRLRRFEIVQPSLHDIFVRIARPEQEPAEGEADHA